RADIEWWGGGRLLALGQAVRGGRVINKQPGRRRFSPPATLKSIQGRFERVNVRHTRRHRHSWSNAVALQRTALSFSPFASRLVRLVLKHCDANSLDQLLAAHRFQQVT